MKTCVGNRFFSLWKFPILKCFSHLFVPVLKLAGTVGIPYCILLVSKAPNIQSSFSMQCTVNTDTPNVVASSWTVYRWSSIIMGLTFSVTENFTTNFQPLLWSSSIKCLPFQNHQCNLNTCAHKQSLTVLDKLINFNVVQSHTKLNHGPNFNVRCWRHFLSWVDINDVILYCIPIMEIDGYVKFSGSDVYVNILKAYILVAFNISYIRCNGHALSTTV